MRGEAENYTTSLNVKRRGSFHERKVLSQKNAVTRNPNQGLPHRTRVFSNGHRRHDTAGDWPRPIYSQGSESQQRTSIFPVVRFCFMLPMRIRTAPTWAVT